MKMVIIIIIIIITTTIADIMWMSYRWKSLCLYLYIQLSGVEFFLRR